MKNKTQKKAVKRPETKSTKTTSKKKEQKNTKPFVNHSTVWNSVGGGFSTPGEAKVFRVGKHKVLVKRSENLNKYGQPIHTATYINQDGTLGASSRSSGSATMIVETALKKNGIETKYKRKTVKGRK